MMNKRGVISLVAGVLVVVGLSMFLLANYGPDTISGATITGGVVGVGEEQTGSGNNLEVIKSTFASSRAFRHAKVQVHYTVREVAELSFDNDVEKFFLIRLSSEGISPETSLSDIVANDDYTRILVTAVDVTELAFKH